MKYGVASITLSCIRTPTRSVSFNFFIYTCFVVLFAISAKLIAAKLHTEYGAKGCSPQGFVATTCCPYALALVISFALSMKKIPGSAEYVAQILIKSHKSLAFTFLYVLT